MLEIKLVPLEYVQELPVMELAQAYLPLADDEATDLIASIEANGIREGLVLFCSVDDTDAQDQLLDGRNRLAAAIKAGLEQVPIRRFVGTIEEAEDLIVDLNEKRRHLNATQRNYIADQHRAIVAKRVKERHDAVVAANLKQNQGDPNMHGSCMFGEEDPEAGKTTRAIIAKKHGAGINGVDTVQKIRRVAEETMQDPDSDGEVMTPRAIRASAVLTKMQKGTISMVDAQKNVFGDPGQDINPDDQSKISSAKSNLNKLVNDLNSFDEHAQVLLELGNDADQQHVGQKAYRLLRVATRINEKYGLTEDEDDLLDPEENRDYWADVESKNRD